MTNPMDLTTVAAVNGILNQGADVDSDLIQTYITDYSQSVLTRTGRSFLSGVKNYVDTVNGTGSETQALRNYPILAVSLLQVNGITIPQSPDYIQSGWVIDQDGSQSFLSIVGGNYGSGWAWGNDRWSPHGNWGSYGNAPPLGQSPYRFMQGIQNVLAVYAAGYTNSVTAEAHTVPDVSPYTVTVDNASAFWQPANQLVIPWAEQTSVSDSLTISNQGAAVASLVLPSFTWGYQRLPYAVDDGVSVNGVQLALVNGTPGPGQFSVSGFGTSTPGVYTFNAAQAGGSALIGYSYGAPPYDLQQAAGMLVAQQYRRRQWIGQNSQSQPGIGQTNYERAEMDLNTAGIIQRYRDRRLP